MQIEWLKPQRQIESVKVGEFGERLKPCPAAPNSRPEGPPSSGPPREAADRLETKWRLSLSLSLLCLGLVSLSLSLWVPTSG